MSFRWCWMLPTFALLLFFGETWQSVRLNRELRNKNAYRRDFYWGTFRLRTDPLGRLPAPPCPPEIPDCKTWLVLPDVIVDPGIILRALLISGFPAWLISIRAIHGLARFGVNEIYSFFAIAPLLLFAWYFLLGFLIDRWRAKRKATPLN
jgi:hypothetical protein